MQNYTGHNIQEVPLSTPFFRNRVVRFLGENDLRLEALDSYYCIQDDEGEILAGAGLCGEVIKCVAVAASARSEGLAAPLLSHVISVASARGVFNLKVFTKPENEGIFTSLGFHVLARAPKALLMEKGRGLEQYCAYLSSFKRPGKAGVVVMNANPFTLGHLYLLQQAAAQVDTLYVIPVKEDVSLFPYAERLEMIQSGVMPGPDRASAVQLSAEIYFSGRYPKNQFSAAIATPTHADAIVVLEGSSYQISALTFPTYFLKDLSDASETQMRLDLDLFARHIAPALNASVRFVGSEPTDPLTARYNELMKEVLPAVVEIPRLPAEGNYFSGRHPKNQFPSAIATPSRAHADAVSASSVRAALEEGSFARASALCPRTSWPYLLAALVHRALRLELDTPCKPGLVGPDSNGAHKDMTYATMQAGIAALRPFWSRMVLASSPEALRELGIAAEESMLKATGGVNTHRGAIFCMGLALYAWAQGAHNEKLMQSSIGKIARGIFDNNQTVNHLAPRAAMANALSGYRELFEDWLPYYASGAGELKTLLRIMSTLDDTCVIKRAGAERAQQVKEEILRFAQNDNCHPEEPEARKDLQILCKQYAAEGISPGGAADMLALTIFIHSIIL